MKSVMLFLILLLFYAVCITIYIRNNFGYAAVPGNASYERNAAVQFSIFGKIYGRRKKRPKKKKEVPPENSLNEQQIAEFNKRREEYESRYTNVRPAKRMSGSPDEEDPVQSVKRNGEKSNRVQQYCADEINMRGKRKTVDREAEIKKAQELQKQLENEEDRLYMEQFGAVGTFIEIKAVDREAELKKAQELQKQLEDEEEEKFRNFILRNK